MVTLIASLVTRLAYRHVYIDAPPGQGGDVGTGIEAAVDEVTKIGEVAAAVILAGDAGRAFAAGHAWGEDHFLANAHGSDIRSDLGDFTGNVTAGNVW